MFDIAAQQMSRAMDADTLKRLDELDAHVRRYSSEDMDATNFWDGFWALAGPVDAMAVADDVAPVLRERYAGILAVANERGFPLRLEQDT